jgi:hypothetical protein
MNDCAGWIICWIMAQLDGRIFVSVSRVVRPFIKVRPH